MHEKSGVMGWVRKMNTIVRIALFALMLGNFGAQASSETKSEDWKKCPNIQGEFPLHEIFMQFNRNEIRNGDLSTAKCLLDGGYNINTLNDKGFSALRYALPQSFEVVRFLLDRGASVDADNEVMKSSVINFTSAIENFYKTPSLMDRVVPLHTREQLEEYFLDSEKIFFAILEAGGDLNSQKPEAFAKGSTLTFDLIFSVCNWEVYSQYNVRKFFSRIKEISNIRIILSKVDVEALTLLSDAPALNTDNKLVSQFPLKCMKLALEYFEPKNN